MSPSPSIKEKHVIILPNAFSSDQTWYYAADEKNWVRSPRLAKIFDTFEEAHHVYVCGPGTSPRVQIESLSKGELMKRILKDR